MMKIVLLRLQPTILVNRDEAGKILREAAGLESPLPGDVVQWDSEGFSFGSPNRQRIRNLVGPGTYEVAPRDSVILADATLGVVTLNLPPALKVVWRVLSVKKLDASANSVSIVPRLGELIDGAASVSTTTQYEAFTFISDGSAWWLL